MGFFHFGNISDHQLPHSRLPVRMPINVNLFPDMVFREEAGIAPDLWVSAADAVNYTITAVRAGTINTQQPLSPGVLQQPLETEDPWFRDRLKKVQWLLIAALPVAAVVWAYFNRRKPQIDSESLVLATYLLAHNYRQKHLVGNHRHRHRRQRV